MPPPVDAEILDPGLSELSVAVQVHRSEQCHRPVLAS
jgi:hypothetical protein